MSASKPGSRAARTARQPPVIGRACGRGHRRRATRLAVVSAGTVLLAAACGGGSPAASPGGSLYQQSLAYSRCMRVHGVPDFPILKQGPRGSLVHPVSPPTGMLTSPGYDAAFRACLKLAVVGGGSPARYRAMAFKGLAQAECMRAHGITGYPSPGALDGGLHEPDATAIGLDTHTPQFAAAARACGMAGGLWQAQWWWPAGLSQP